MATATIPTLLMVGKIAGELDVSLSRVLYVLATRRHILPAARAGTLRLYRQTAVAQIRHELTAIDARRSARRNSTRVRSVSDLPTTAGQQN